MARPPVWSAQELKVVDRFARAVIAGRYAGAGVALSACHEALSRGTRMRRTRAAVRQKLRERAHVLGWSPPPRIWKRTEQRVVERFARAVAGGKYTDASTAVHDCRQALAKAHVPRLHSDEALVARIRAAARMLGRSVRQPWTPEEIQVVDRFAREVVAGGYRSAHAAAGRCAEMVARTAQTARRSDERVRSKLSQRICLISGRGQDTWPRREAAVVDRFARAVAAGRYRSVPAALADCRRALAARGRVPARGHREVLERLWERTALFQPRYARRMTAGEQAVIERFAGAVAAHRYPSVASAVRDCWRALLERPGRTEEEPARSLRAVAGWLKLLARDIGRYKISGRRWTDAEERVNRKWVRVFARHREGRGRANLDTAAAMMRAELARLGYFRTGAACYTRIYAAYRREAAGQ